MNFSIGTFSDQLAQVYSDIADLQITAKAILDAAKDAGINTRALSKLAKEMNTDSDKLRKKYDDESQLELFREQVSIHRLKGLDTREAVG